ncbi:MAG: 50S ribosomal protein L18 [Achromobacter sp.]|jgi:large subunit ribosomal protein L18|nr:50S ribosomal protein L18 [Achromobacter sp.]
MEKKFKRQRRGRATRAQIRKLGVTRLCVYRTAQHTYAQVIDASGGRVLAAASTLEKPLAGQLGHTGNVEAARLIGRVIAERAQQAGVGEVAFDRSGFKYHGRVKALADAAREAGLKF